MPTPLALTYTFVAGDTARAAEVNSNFNDVLNYLNTTGVCTYQAGSVGKLALAATGIPGKQIARSCLTVTQSGGGDKNSINVTGDNLTDVRLTFFSSAMSNDTGSQNASVEIRDGATPVGKTGATIVTGGFGVPCYVECVVPAFSGTKTFNVHLTNDGTGGNPSFNASVAVPACIEARWV